MSNDRRVSGSVFAAVLFFAACFGGAPDSRASSFKVLHAFCTQINCADGAEPNGLLVDSAGTLFGTTELGNPNNGGTVFRMSPASASGSSWTETVLTVFCPTPGEFTVCRSGVGPVGLVADAKGNLFGVTQSGGLDANPPYYGGNGLIYKLSPPGSGQTRWTSSVIHMFGGAAVDGSLPNSGLAIDASGNLYGTTQRGVVGSSGIVFKLSPPAPGQTGWRLQILHRLSDTSLAGPVIDRAGNLYGTTSRSGQGSVFILSHPTQGRQAWTFSTLHSFCLRTGCTDGGDPTGRLTLDRSGNIYGVTAGGGAAQLAVNGGGGGTAFALMRPSPGQKEWQFKLLYSFCRLAYCADGALPAGGMVLSASGDLYGTTLLGGAYYNGGGTIFRLSPPPPGGRAWTQTVLRKFCLFTTCTDGAAPQSLTYAGAASGGLYNGSAPLYGLAASHGRAFGGTVFQFTP